jgi:pyruvate dehydrogenase E2 component (dihydrolipoamide acetyltransferase)
MEERLDNLGEGIESGTIAEVLIAVGDEISEGQTLIEIESEKTIVPVPARNGGVVTKLLVSNGESISVGQAILEYQAPTGKVAGSQGKEVPSTTAPVPQTITRRDNRSVTPSFVLPGPAPSASGPQPAASPTVRRIAHQLQLDLRLVTSRSRGDRVELSDLSQWIQSLIAISTTPQTDASLPPKAHPVIPFESWGPVKREKLSEIRKAISRHMVDSKNTQPHVTQFETIDITDLEASRKSHSPEWKQAGCPLTLTALATTAAVSALQKHPIFNSSVDESTQEIVFKDYYHIGIATDTEHGLMVPIIRNAAQKTLSEIASSIPELANQARSRTLSPEKMKGGSFTISNQGGIGGGHFTPIINRPEVAILGIGKAIPQACAVDGRVQIRLMLPLTLSYDHSVIDGGTAVRFLLDLIAALQSLGKDDLTFSKHHPKKEKKS